MLHLSCSVCLLFLLSFASLSQCTFFQIGVGMLLVDHNSARCKLRSSLNRTQPRSSAVLSLIRFRSSHHHSSTPTVTSETSLRRTVVTRISATLSRLGYEIPQTQYSCISLCLDFLPFPPPVSRALNVYTSNARPHHSLQCCCSPRLKRGHIMQIACSLRVVQVLQ